MWPLRTRSFSSACKSPMPPSISYWSFVICSIRTCYKNLASNERFDSSCSSSYASPLLLLWSALRLITLEIVYSFINPLEMIQSVSMRLSFFGGMCIPRGTAVQYSREYLVNFEKSPWSAWARRMKLIWRDIWIISTKSSSLVSLSRAWLNNLHLAIERRHHGRYSLNLMKGLINTYSAPERVL